MTPGIYQKSIF